MSAIKQQVQDYIANNKVVIFSKSYCPYCTLAKECFNKVNTPFVAVELDNLEETDAYQDVLGEMTGARSVPRVFVNGQFIGGGSDVKALLDQGKLQELVQ